MDYQVLQTAYSFVNHVALVPRGRGGPDASIQDAAPGPLSAIWSWITKTLKGGVSDDATFRQQLEEFAKMRDALTEETAEDKLTPLYECVAKMPWDEDKDLLYRYLGDAKLIIGRDDAEANLFVTTVADLYEKAEERSLAEIMNTQKKEAQEDAMTEEEKKAEEAKKAQSDAESKELEGFMTKVKDHIAGGGKISDWAVKGKKAEDEEAEETAEEKKKREDAEKAKKAEDDEAENAKKEEEEKKKEKAAEDAGPSLLGQYDAAPFNMSMDFNRRAPSSEAGKDLLGKLGFFGDPKEKK
jgi:hypothetical protein